MMFKKALFLLFVSSLLFGCGYEPLYLKNNNLEKSIKTIKFEGNEKINRKIISFLGLKEMKNSKLNFELKLISQKKLEVISKDKGGNPSVYKNSIIVDLLLNDGQKIIKQKQFQGYSNQGANSIGYVNQALGQTPNVGTTTKQETKQNGIFDYLTAMTNSYTGGR